MKRGGKRYYNNAGLPPTRPPGVLNDLGSRAMARPEPVKTADIYFRVMHRNTMVEAIFEKSAPITTHKRKPHWDLGNGCFVPLERKGHKFFLLNHRRES